MDIEAVNRELERAPAGERIDWAARNLARVVHGSSFGPEDVAIIHMSSGELPTIFLDTNYHFEETLELVERVKGAYSLDLEVYSAYGSREDFEEENGRLYEEEPDECCRINKVEPLGEALEGVDAWITGLRREQSPTREGTRIVEGEGERLKISPLADWTGEDLWNYIEENGVPTNPLHDRGYPSIGCAPCTSPVEAGEDERAGRWSGSGKTECGLHPPDDPGD
ncbi:MAG: Phosphoadenosine phosphosulfate reductase [Methanonatronarchaeales archaeon]|nr:Phosphoadenosine phosphosulfate reductase [Methanonatronarchaeales archaeon]